MQAPDKSEDSAAGETEPSPSSPSLGSLQLHVAIKKEKPFLRLLPPLVIVTSDETTIALPLSPRKMVEETDFLDDERPLSPGMTQRVRQEIDESYRHARLKAKALSSRGIENESGLTHFYQPKLFTSLDGHLAPGSPTSGSSYHRARAQFKRHSSIEFATKLVREAKREEEEKAAAAAKAKEAQESGGAPLAEETSFERQARIVKEQMRIFALRMREREMIARLEKAQRQEQQQQINSSKPAAVATQELVHERGAVPPVIEDASLDAESAAELIEPTDLESYLQALDDERQISAITLPALGIGDDGLAQLLDRLPPLKPITPVVGLITTLILDANDIERHGAAMLANFLKTNDHVECLSLKWNMIGFDGAESLAEALKVNSRLTTLQLEGNGIDSDGAIAIADALKVNTSLTDVNLKENGLGNSGVDAISEALLVNSTLNCLDLSSNGISYAGTTLAESLRSNRGLRYLMLNENALFDAGATALADTLATNSTLTSLELRDNSISEDGILALTDAVQTNTVLVDLNVKLNQPGLRGEIALFKLLKSRPDFELIWKDEGVESTWDASQCRDIIQHFGADSVLRQLVEGEGLSPLVGRELLLEHLYIDNTKTAHRFFDSIFPESRVVRLEGIEVLMQLLKKRKASSAEAYGQALKDLPHLLQALHAKLDWITSMLRLPAAPRHEPPAKDNCAKLSEVSLGFLRLKILEMLPLIVDLGYKVLDAKLVQANTFATCIDIFYSNPFNNFIHHGVNNFLMNALITQRQALIDEAIVKCGLLDRMTNAFREEAKKPVAQRAGYLGHLAKLANEIAAIDSADFHTLLNSNSRWVRFVQRELRELNELDREWSKGRPERPARSDQSCGVRSREEALGSY